MLYIFLKQYAITAPVAGMLYPGLVPLMYGENQVPVPVSMIMLLVALLVPYLLGSFNTAVFISKGYTKTISAITAAETQDLPISCASTAQRRLL